MYVTLVHRLFGFDGRLGRLGYVLLIALCLGLAAVPALLGVLASRQDTYLSILAGFALAAMIAIWGCTALTVQRLHDFGYSGLHTVWIAALAAALPILDDHYPLALPALLFLLGLITVGVVFVPGDKDENRFGIPPR